MKRILIIISILLVNLYANGQVYLGLSSGVAITKFKIYESSSTFNNPKCKSLIGFNIDMPILFKLNKNIAIQSGLSYLNMGTTIDADYSSYNVIDVNDPIYQALITGGDTKYRLNYLSIPLTFNFTIPLNKYSVYARAGGYMSTLLYGTSKRTETKEKRKLDLDDEELNTVDVGGIFGLGVTRNIGNGYVFFDAKYMIGTSNLNESSYLFEPPFGVHELNNRGLFLNVGYMFNLGKS